MLFFMLVFLGCSAREPRPEFVVAIESYPSSLDPRYPLDAYSSKVQSLLFNGLLKLDDQLNLVPDLAESYEWVSDTRLRFHLKEGVKFHDGSPLRVADVIATYEVLRDPAKGSPLHATFKKIRQMLAVDERTLEIELREAYVPFLTALTVGIVPSKARQQEDFRDYPVGTGPFRFVAKKSDRWIRLASYESYFETVPKIRDLQILTVPDDTTRVLMMLRREVDLVQNAIPWTYIPWLETHSDLQKKIEPGINYVYLGFNLRDSVLKHQRVREAIAMALDRETLIRYQMEGLGRPATGVLAPSNPFYEGQVSVEPYDPEAAKRLLDQAGFPDPDGDGPQKRFVLSYKTSNKRDRVAMARAIADQLGEVGIGVELYPYEWGTFFRDIRTGNFQMYSSTWVGVSDPDIYFNLFHSGMFPPQGANRGFYQNESVDTLVEAARMESDPEQRRAYYSQVQKMLSLELPYVSLWYEDNVVFMQPEVVGYTLRPDASFLGLVETRKLSLPQGSREKSALR